MLNTNSSFYGQQTDERILYAVRPHPLAYALLLIKFLISAGVIFLVAVVIGEQNIIAKYADLFVLGGGILAGLVAGVGFWVVENASRKNIAYITDRRIAKFEASTPLATNLRSLNWEEAVKVKTFPSNMLWKQLMVGSVVVHARTTIAPLDGQSKAQSVTDDDVELKDVYYYRDLGNYIEKILFLYKKQPKDIATLKSFVPKAKGKRY